MINLYFACKWKLNLESFDLLHQLHEEVEALNCKFVILNKPHEISIDGYYKQFVALSCPSHEILDMFVQQIGKQAGLTDWYSIFEKEFESGYPLQTGHFYSSLYELASYNDRQREVNEAPEKFHYDKPIEGLNLSDTTLKRLRGYGYVAVGDILDMVRRDPKSLLNIRNFTQAMLDEVMQKLAENGYSIEQG